jgi:hypothetical protein
MYRALRKNKWICYSNGNTTYINLTLHTPRRRNTGEYMQHGKCAEGYMCPA